MKIKISVLIFTCLFMFDVNAGKFKQIKTKDGGTMILIPKSTMKIASLKSFYIDKYEVTNAQYRAFLLWVTNNTDKTVKHPDQPINKDHTPRFWKNFKPILLDKHGIGKLQDFSSKTFTKDDHPVVGIDWFDAYAYSKWAGKRLPSKLEWETAAMGPEKNIWPWGNKWHFQRCNSGGYEWKGERDGFIYSAPVTSYHIGASYYGCFNMAGNVWEWIDKETAKSATALIKGGGSDSYPSATRVLNHKEYELGFRHFTLGFRCAKDK